MQRRELLRYWMEQYGRLSPASRQRFLRRQDAGRLARYPDDIIRKAINWSSLLADALSFAHSLYEGDQRPLPPEPRAPSRQARSHRVAKTQPKPDLELDRRLAAEVGPVQNYDDSF
jgi:hypothetical protein